MIHHSDHGSQLQRSAEAKPSTSLALSKRLEQENTPYSLGAVGKALANAVAESFFSTLQAELLDKQPRAKRAELRLANFEYLEVFYNRQRLHFSLGDLSPTEFEANWQGCYSRLGGDELLTIYKSQQIHPYTGQVKKRLGARVKRAPSASHRFYLKPGI